MRVFSRVRTAPSWLCRVTSHLQQTSMQSKFLNKILRHNFATSTLPFSLPEHISLSHHEGRMYQGTPYAVEPDATARTMFIASMMHAHVQKPILSERPDVTCPDDTADNDRQKKSYIKKYLEKPEAQEEVRQPATRRRRHHRSNRSPQFSRRRMSRTRITSTQAVICLF